MRAPMLFVPHLGGLLLALASVAVAQGSGPLPVRVQRVSPSAGRVLTISERLTPAGLDPRATALQALQGQAAQDPAAAAAAAAGNARMQAFKQLIFDRRPSSILAAWAAPELVPYDPQQEQQGADGAAEGEGAEPGGGEGPGGAARPGVSPVVPTASGSQPLSAEEIARLIEADLATSSTDKPAGTTASGTATRTAAAPTAVAQPGLTPEQKKQQREFEILQRDVTLGRWPQVGAFLGTFPEPDRKAAYEHLLTVLPRHPPMPNQRVPANLQEKNRFAFEDAFALAALAPGGFDKEQGKLLVPIVQRALEDGSVPEEFVRLLGLEVQKPAPDQRLDRREAAMLLAQLGMETELAVFLPTASEAEQHNDREALNLLARHALAMYAQEQRSVWLETAWQVTQAVLAKGEVSEEEKQEALRRAVELAPKVKESLGPAWLAESFTARPERGMEIIATIGGQVAKGFQEHAQDAKYRADGLLLQKNAVESLLAVAPELAEQWRPTLGLLAAGWILEASHSYTNSRSDSFGPMMQRDAFGNIFYSNQRMGGGGQVVAVEPVDLLEAQPNAGWVALLDDALRPHFTTVSAQLWLKVNEYEKAFPYIEQLAATNARKAKDLAEEFLRVWMRNNNPNSNNRTNSYMFVYGFNQRANGIPLTRSKQERNLEELGVYVERLRLLPIGGVDESLLAQAFVAAHSVAEVYQLETIERVFGPVGELDPRLLGQLIGTMRTNLATVWQRPAVQEAEKTRRSQKEMLDEVAKGYETALTLARDAMAARGQHWALQSVVATILHDQNNFAREQQRSSDFSEVRKSAFELFAEACDHYAATVEDLRLDEETVLPHTSWFYAALGACDLGAVTEETVLAQNQLPRIRSALDDLPDGARERHLAMFANQLFTRMTAVQPQMKYRYLQAGFEIVGDHPQAAEAKKVWDYYQDLIHELRLEATVDGSTEVGTEPFGLRVDIVHSPEIERESGGFQKYATNQNNQPYAYNYGRPLENYRDKFHDAAIAALQEHFEILSVTFNSEQMTSMPTDAPDWRRTPYAYLLLQARGPQVDRIPTMQLDFDFLDTSGFAVLPVGSPVVAIDASAAPEQRPFADIEVNQLLDERRADEGKVTLEVKAKAKGLVPQLEQFLDLQTPGFVVDKRDDQGAVVVRFAEDQENIESERVWLLALKPESEGLVPASFRFGAPTVAGVTAVYQRYDDADLETVPAEIALSGALQVRDPVWAWVVIGIAGLLYLIWLFFGKTKNASGQQVEDTLRMPEHVTPFTVLALLQRVASRGSLDASLREQLQADMQRIEVCHFGRANDEADAAPDLGKIASQWLQKAS